ncbi:methyltransferase domain-containing protein [Carnobacterium sp.]|uniref:methyltransferase domain-containing protein n=1 Tax=Carnobacterium sp. TaxID=48221 RepID=UPI002FCB51AE
MSYTKINETTWNRWSNQGIRWSQPVTPETFAKAKRGDWDISLTTQVFVPKNWFGDLQGKKVLGLASAGGQQCPILVAAGAEVTIMDLSIGQLEKEAVVAEREGYHINIVKSDMTETFPFEDEEFDLIFHPVSNCFVADLEPIWKECYRVLKPGGRLLSGFCNPELYMFNNASKPEEIRLIHPLPYNPLTDFNDEERQTIIEDDGLQFSHSLETQIRGQLQAGFLLKDFYEDFNKDADYLLSTYFPLFFASLAIKF